MWIELDDGKVCIVSNDNEKVSVGYRNLNNNKCRHVTLQNSPRHDAHSHQMNYTTNEYLI